MPVFGLVIRGEFLNMNVIEGRKFKSLFFVRKQDRCEGSANFYLLHLGSRFNSTLLVSKTDITV